MKGIRVVDLTSVLSGPFCTWLLASMGADVVKVESPDGDVARTTPPLVDGASVYFASLNRGKRSLVLDLKTSAGREALHRLLARADVFVENMRPGVRERLGCGEQALARVNPRLVCASISGFGQSGPLADRPAYDIVVQAMSGMMSINGPPGGPPTRVGFSVGDIAAALFTTIGILERLYRRDAQSAPVTGTLDVSMLACQWACMENAFARYLNAGVVPGPIGSRHPSMTPFEPYPTADRDIVIALGSARDWPRLCAALDLPGLRDDPRFAADEARLANRDLLHELLSARLRRHDAAHWTRALLAHGIPCSTIETVDGVADSALARGSAAFSEVATGEGLSQRFVRSPLAGRETAESAAPALGQHSAEVLRELGYDETAIARLAAR